MLNYYRCKLFRKKHLFKINRCHCFFSSYWYLFNKGSFVPAKFCKLGIFDAVFTHMNNMENLDFNQIIKKIKKYILQIKIMDVLILHYKIKMMIYMYLLVLNIQNQMRITKIFIKYNNTSNCPIRIILSTQYK